MFSICTTDHNDKRRPIHKTSLQFKRDDNFSGKNGQNDSEFLNTYMDATID